MPAHSYRLNVTVGAQPLRSGALFAEEAGGTLQRVLWFDAEVPKVDESDVDDEDLDHVPAPPMPITLPDFGRGLATVNENGPVYYFDVDTEIRREIRRDKRIRRWEGADAHRNLVKLKAAAAFAVLHGSTTITPDVWDVAEAIMFHSTTTREAVRETLAKAAAAEAHERATSRGRAAVTEASTREVLITRVAQALMKWMDKHPAATPTASQLKERAITGADRSLVAEAVALLVESERITEAGQTRVGTPMFKRVKA